jgi:hypothetical protein
MTKETVLVHTQYEENYGFHNGTSHWKKKSGHTFQIKMDADVLMYADPITILAVFNKMLESQSNMLERFTYVDHEIQFQEPNVLGTEEDFMSIMQELQHCS